MNKNIKIALERIRAMHIKDLTELLGLVSCEWIERQKSRDKGVSDIAETLANMLKYCKEKKMGSLQDRINYLKDHYGGEPCSEPLRSALGLMSELASIVQSLQPQAAKAETGEATATDYDWKRIEDWLRHAYTSDAKWMAETERECLRRIVASRGKAETRPAEQAATGQAVTPLDADIDSVCEAAERYASVCLGNTNHQYQPLLTAIANVRAMKGIDTPDHSPAMQAAMERAASFFDKEGSKCDGNMADYVRGYCGGLLFVAAALRSGECWKEKE